MATFKLCTHPAAPCAFVGSFDVQLRWTDAQCLQLTYLIEGDLQHLRLPVANLPAPGLPARTPELWRHTCCEIFLRNSGERAYQEFNFAPSGQWAAYTFSAYRQDMRDLALDDPPQIKPRLAANVFRLDVTLRSPILARPTPQAALSAVLEHDDGRLSYWALAHPRERPDFHDERAFEDVSRDKFVP